MRRWFKCLVNSSTVVKPSPRHPKVMGLNPTTAAGEKIVEKNCEYLFNSSVVKQLPRHLMVKGLSPATTTGTSRGGGDGEKSFVNIPTLVAVSHPLFLYALELDF